MAHVCAHVPSHGGLSSGEDSIEMQVTEPLEDSGCVFSALQVENPPDTKCIPIKIQDTPAKI